jgi:hypothetical protein
MASDKQILAIVHRMRLLFVGTGLKFASRETVEKWAQELEEIVSPRQPNPRGDDGRM